MLLHKSVVHSPELVGLSPVLLVIRDFLVGFVKRCLHVGQLLVLVRKLLLRVRKLLPEAPNCRLCIPQLCSQILFLFFVCVQQSHELRDACVHLASVKVLLLRFLHVRCNLLGVLLEQVLDLHAQAFDRERGRFTHFFDVFQQCLLALIFHGHHILIMLEGLLDASGNLGVSWYTVLLYERQKFKHEPPFGDQARSVSPNLDGLSCA
mmetsp:Transcript_23313/g.55478  ORF Transcript_23313/g.55478 Transcript_23313/m.55478 type:complete len:207 (-) Transcript_23313:658-1278(-)